ncbi:sugar phosphate permease [Advenella incenata]|uniref:Sugar phosphate permease n=1 Tax=Advenella incenata TaxID=267800 RepID=A0A4Q7VFU8_9BURK|nr:MFS transporter [Advenella incenata]RZT94861.1 sugar phosphate permease [Advenella incenata]
MEYPKSEWRMGWKVVLSGALGMGTGYGLLMMTAGLFVKPMQEEFGWSRTALSILPIMGVVSALVLPLTGYLVDRWGPRVVGTFGLVSLMLGCVGFCFVPPDKFLFYCLVIVLGALASASGAMTWVRGVATWFDQSKGLAFGLTFSGISIISAIVLPVLSGVIDDWGWRAGFFVLSLMILFLGLPTVLLWFRERTQEINIDEISPKKIGSTPGFSLALRSPRFWLIFVCFSLVSFPVGGFMYHLVPILTDKGINIQMATAAASAFALSIALGRVAAGFLLDKLWPPGVVCFFFLIPILGVTLVHFLQPHWDWVGPIAALSGVLIGFAQGAEADFAAYLVARYYPIEVFARVYSLLGAAIYGAIALGGVAFATIHDVFSDHAITMMLAGACYLAGGLMILLIEKIEPSLSAEVFSKSEINLKRAEQ